VPHALAHNFYFLSQVYFSSLLDITNSNLEITNQHERTNPTSEVNLESSAATNSIASRRKEFIRTRI